MGAQVVVDRLPSGTIIVQLREHDLLTGNTKGLFAELTSEEARAIGQHLLDLADLTPARQISG